MKPPKRPFNSITFSQIGPFHCSSKGNKYVLTCMCLMSYLIAIPFPDVLSVDGQVILVATALMSSVMAVMNLATLPRTAPTRFLHKEHNTTMADLIQGINTPTNRGTDHTPTMVPYIGDITADHSPIPIHTMTEAAALEGTPCTLLSVTAAANATLHL